jgi:hypothetical protein
MGFTHQALNGSPAGFLMPRVTERSVIPQSASMSLSGLSINGREAAHKRGSWHGCLLPAEGRCQVIAGLLSGGRYKLSRFAFKGCA